MPAICKTCLRDDVAQINAMLTNGRPSREIMDKFAGLSNGGLQRHKETCIRGLFAEVRDAKRLGLLADIDEVKAEILEVKQQFADNGQVRVQLIARRLDAIEKEAKLVGAYQKDGQNQGDLDRAARAYQQFLDDFPAISEADKTRYLDLFAKQAGVLGSAIVQHLEGVQ